MASGNWEGKWKGKPTPLRNWKHNSGKESIPEVSTYAKGTSQKVFNSATALTSQSWRKIIKDAQVVSSQGHT